MIRVGCSGWNYREWRGRFYPETLPVKRWLEFYARHFDTVEINNSFYRLPTDAAFDKWGEVAPDGFCFAVKASRYITHMKRLKDVEEPVARFIDHARKLGGHLGPILYQLPPRWHYDGERLETFLKLLPGDLVHVVEFRDRSWMTEEACALLDRYGVSFCTHDLPGLATPRWATGRAAYVRFHGTEGKYRGRYSDAALEKWAVWMMEQEKAGRDVWAYFNNDLGSDAIADTRNLLRLLGREDMVSQISPLLL